LERERERVAGINGLAERFRLERTFAQDLVRRGVSLDEARRRVLDHLAASDDAVTTFPHLATPLGGADESATRAEAVTSALLHRYDPTAFALSEPAREYRGMTLLDLARDWLETQGERVRGLSRDELARRALEVRAGFHTISDFPSVLAAVANKALRQAYEAAPRTFTPFSRQVFASDFKDMHRVQLSGMAPLKKVNEHGEFTAGTLYESKESYRIESYGEVINITRQVLINDDLDAFTRVPALMASKVAQLESDVVWSVFLTNQTMADGNPLFDAAHGNLAGVGAALSVTSVGAARTAMAQQKDLDGTTVLNIRPAFILVPSALELTAEPLLAQNLVPAQTANVVPASIRSLSVISEPRLDADSTTAWYLAASPVAIDTLEYAYLEGQPGAFTETRAGFDVDGVQMKVRIDFGAKAIDWRGLYKDPGA